MLDFMFVCLLWILLVSTVSGVTCLFAGCGVQFTYVAIALRYLR